MSPPWATDDVENVPAFPNAQGRHVANAKASASSVKDVLYGGPPVVQSSPNPKSYGQHNNYGCRPAPFATYEDTQQQAQRGRARQAPFATNIEEDPYGPRRVQASNRKTQYGDKNDKFAVGADKVGSVGFSQGSMDAAANAYAEAHEAAHSARRRQQSGSSVFSN